MIDYFYLIPIALLLGVIGLGCLFVVAAQRAIRGSGWRSRTHLI